MEVEWEKASLKRDIFQAISGTAQARVHDFICQKKEKLIQDVSSKTCGVGAQDTDSTSDKQRNAVNVRKDTMKYGKDGHVKNGSGVKVRNG